MKYLFVLTLCSVAMFLVVVRVRPDLVNVDFSNFPPRNEAERTEPPKTVEKKKIRVEAPAASRVQQPGTGSYSPPADNPESNRQNDGVPSSRGPQRVVQTTTVASDSITVYAANSVNSRVLTVLKKGDHVETTLGVLDSEGSWSLIRVPSQRISGYVLRENLELKQPSKAENQ